MHINIRHASSMDCALPPLQPLVHPPTQQRTCICGLAASPMYSSTATSQAISILLQQARRQGVAVAGKRRRWGSNMCQATCRDNQPTCVPQTAKSPPASHPPAQVLAQHAGEETEGHGHGLAPPGGRGAVHAQRAGKHPCHCMGGPGAAAGRQGRAGQAGGQESRAASQVTATPPTAKTGIKMLFRNRHQRGAIPHRQQTQAGRQAQAGR
jgi:hypothetical protein